MSNIHIIPQTYLAGRTSLSFLYQTRTILRQSHYCLSSSSTPRRFASTTHHQHGHQLKHLASEALGHAPDIPTSAVPTAINIASTITSRERAAFMAVLHTPKSQATNSSPATGPPRPKEPYDRLNFVNLDIDSILDLFSLSSNSEQPSDSSSINHTPPKLPSTTPSPSLDTRKSPTTLQHQNQSKPESGEIRQRLVSIATSLNEALSSPDRPGDMALWDACEHHVFSMAKSLTPASRRAVKKHATGKSASATPRPETPSTLDDHREQDADAQPEGILNSDSDLPLNAATKLSDPTTRSKSETRRLVSHETRVLHHLYPIALLYALRLFAKRFPDSDLAFNILPRIRELGNTSFVLGTSTQFYNSLIAHRWNMFSSLREVDALLSEMEQIGIEMNYETRHILQSIDNDRAQDQMQETKPRLGSSRARGPNWWKKHEQLLWFAKIQTWANLIDRRLTKAQAIASYKARAKDNHVPDDYEVDDSESDENDPNSPVPEDYDLLKGPASSSLKPIH